MKKNKLHLLSLPVSIALTQMCFAQFGAVPNGDFETWALDTAYETLQQWETSNSSFFQFQPTTTKETDKVSGNYSVKLSSYIIGLDTAFGYVLQGHFDNAPDGGFPYTDMVDTIKGWYKYDIQPNDTAMILVGFFVMGNLVWQDMIPITGTQSTWTAFSFPINSPQFTPDSVFVAATSGNALAEQIYDGSWLMLDNLRFASSQVSNPAPIPNGDFENWIDVATEEADNWNTLNPYMIMYSITPVRKTTDKHSGSYAVEMETYHLNNGLDTIPGLLTNGDMDTYGNTGGIPYTAKPDTFYGYYKYIPAGADTGGIFIQFRNNGNVLESQFITFTSMTNTYTPFGIPLNLGSSPDTLLITAIGGVNQGTLLKLDDITLAGGDVGIQPLFVKSQRAVLYPNPASNQVHLIFNLKESSEVLVELTDLSGNILRSLHTGSLTGGHHDISFDLSGMASGAYFLKLSGDNETIVGKLLKR